MICMKPARADEDTCADCDAQPVRMNLGTVALCDRCFDARIAASTGWPRLPEPPEPETIAGPDGRLHRIVYRLWRSPGGVAVEAPAPLVERTRAAIRRRIGRQDLTLGPGGPHWIMAGDDLLGRLVWNEHGDPYDVVVDGRRLGWEEFGRALEPFEGWEFRLSFRHEDVDSDEREPAVDPPDVPIPFAPTPGARLH